MANKKQKPKTSPILAGCLIVFAALILIFIVSSIFRPHQVEGHSASYVVSGSASTAQLTYMKESGGTEQNEVNLPWKHEMKVGTGRFLYISAQNKSDYGTVKVELYVDDGLVQSASSDAKYGIASASGRVK